MRGTPVYASLTFRWMGNTLYLGPFYAGHVAHVEPPLYSKSGWVAYTPAGGADETPSTRAAAQRRLRRIVRRQVAKDIDPRPNRVPA